MTDLANPLNTYTPLPQKLGSCRGDVGGSAAFVASKHPGKPAKSDAMRHTQEAFPGRFKGQLAGGGL